MVTMRRLRNCMKKPFHSINSQLLGSMCLHEKDSQLLNGEISEMISKKEKEKLSMMIISFIGMSEKPMKAACASIYCQKINV